MTEQRVKKTTLACDSCRRRKRKCDGKAPVCSLCEKGNIECVYDTTSDQRRPAQKTYVAALEARVALLESILKESGSGEIPGFPVAQAEETDSASQVIYPTSDQTAPASTAPQSDTQSVSSPEPKFVPTDDADSGLKLMAEPRAQKGENVMSTGELDLGMEKYEPATSLAVEHQLLAQFWDWQRMHMPYVAPVPFLSAYAIYAEAAHPGEPIPPPPPPLDPLAGPTSIVVPSAASVQVTPELAQFISPLLLDSMFSVAALFRGNAEIGEVFYQRARLRVLEEAINPTLATVQGICLLSSWELGNARAPAAWTLNGVAVALCVRLGMNVDATPLVRNGVMSKRYYATCMGMHPLMDRRIISTPRHSSLTTSTSKDSAKNTESTTLTGPNAPTLTLGSKYLGAAPENPTASDVGVTWWSPSTLGMGDIMMQAGWEAIRDLIRMTDILFDGIYAFDAPNRTPQEVLELVTRNNLTIQRFLDDLPTWLRSTGAVRRKDSGIVYLHLFIHLASILTCRPFLSPRSTSEGAITNNAPTNEFQVIRRYRTLAFRVARASGLQIMSLIRHIPLSSPCVTLPYIVYIASTILLLSPEDAAAMDSLCTGLACLESMHETGYWVKSAKYASDRIQALAKRWGVIIRPGKRVLGPVGSGAGMSRPGSKGLDGGALDPKNIDDPSLHPQDFSHDTRLTAPDMPGSNPTSGSHLTSGLTGNIHPPTYADLGGPLTISGVYTSTQLVPHIEFQPAPIHYSSAPPTQGPDDVSSQMYAAQLYPGNLGMDLNQHDIDAAIAEALHGLNQGYISVFDAQDSEPCPVGNDPLTQRSGMVLQIQPPTCSRHPDPQLYSQSSHYVPQPQYARDPLAAKRRQECQHQAERAHHHPYTCPSNQARKSQPFPHVAYGASHAEPQHDLHLPHTHWHPVLPPTDPTLPFPPDLTACTDLAACFSYTVENAQDPAFLDSTADPYASVAIDWLTDPACSFPTMTLDTYNCST